MRSSAPSLTSLGLSFFHLENGNPATCSTAILVRNEMTRCQRPDTMLALLLSGPRFPHQLSGLPCKPQSAQFDLPQLKFSLCKESFACSYPPRPPSTSPTFLDAGRTSPCRSYGVHVRKPFLLLVLLPDFRSGKLALQTLGLQHHLALSTLHYNQVKNGAMRHLPKPCFGVFFSHQ